MRFLHKIFFSLLALVLILASVSTEHFKSSATKTLDIGQSTKGSQKRYSLNSRAKRYINEEATTSATETIHDDVKKVRLVSKLSESIEDPLSFFDRMFTRIKNYFY